MQVDKKLFCHWDLVRFVSEKNLRREDGTFYTLSITDGDKLEFMIFLGKDDSSTDYEVRIYKSKPSDKYVPNNYDCVKKYEDNDEYASFFFETYNYAREFIDSVSYRHPEFKERPVRKIGEEN